MGYFTNRISKNPDKDTAKFSLSENPNFIQFERLSETNIEPITMKIINPGYYKSPDGDTVNYSKFKIIEKTNYTEHIFHSQVPDIYETYPPGTENIFSAITSGLPQTAQNVAACMANNKFLGAKFDISISPEDNTAIVIKPKAGATDYLFDIRPLVTSQYYFYEIDGLYEKIPAGNDKYIDTRIQITGDGYKIIKFDDFNIPVFKNVSAFSITESKTQKTHHYRGVSSHNDVSDSTFYIGEAALRVDPVWVYAKEIAESLFNCLTKNEFLSEKFELTLPPMVKDGNLVKGDTIYIKSKGCGDEYTFSIQADESVGQADFENALFKIPKDTGESYSTDTISEGNSSVEIQIDMYKDADIFPGQDGKPDTNKKMGTYVTSLSKAYFGQPLWFNINLLDSKQFATDFLSESYQNTWFDTGTANKFRYVAKRFIANKEKYGKETFYYSDVFYTLSGYDRTLEKNDLSAYVFDAYINNAENPVKPLTSQPTLFHSKGQHQFFNFIFADRDREEDDYRKNFNIGLTYKLYSQSGRFIQEIRTQTTGKQQMGIANTTVLDIDRLTADHNNVGIVEVYLSIQYYPGPEPPIQVSHPLTFRILPPCLHKVNDFAFLNRLGGWSSFNFAGTEENEFKATANTFHRTQLPGFDKSSQLEAVYNKTVEEKFTVQSMPVTREVAEWLKELSSSKAVYELSTGRYVIVDELTIKPNSKDDLFRLDMKYRYSDMYN